MVRIRNETFHILAGLARRGRNVMAVELHGAHSGSADAVFDLELERLAAPLARFLSPPPTAVTFEHPELQALAGTGAVRRLHPTYAGWDYAHQRIPDGQYSYQDVFQPLDRSLFTGAPFPSFVFCLSYHSRDLRTAPATVANFREVAVSVDLLAEHLGPFGEEDRLRVDLFVAEPGGFGNPARIPWLEIGAPSSLPGEAPVALPPESLVSPNATFTRFTTPPGMIPDSALTVMVRIVARSASAHTAFYLDNLAITGTAIEPHDYASFMRIRGGAPSVPPPNGDWDADGLENFLEYALGGDPFVAGGTLSPSLDFSPDGFVELTHPRLGGDLVGDVDRGLQVADVRYRGQFSPDGRHWFDGLGAPVFTLLPASPDRPHTVRLRSLFPLGREHATGLFRVRVEAAPPLRGTLQLADPFATPLFEP